MLFELAMSWLKSTGQLPIWNSSQIVPVKIGGIEARFCTCTGAKPAITPVTSREQGATASCKSCGGGPSVDGIGSVGSASMMSAVGLELTNFINPELTWKKVAKGYRSALRRKPVVRNFTIETKLSDEGGKNADDMTASDTEKHGVAVLGRRFSGNSGKNEHVPIKKRRFTAQSPLQAPRTTSSRVEGVEPNLNGKRRRRAADSSVATNFRQKTSEVNGKSDYSDDFSGIEILAAVACNNGMIIDADRDEESSVMEGSTREGVDSSSSAVPFKETVASPKDLQHEDKTEASSLQNNTVTVLQASAGTKDSRAGAGSLLSRDEMLNLDLNVAWEQQPCETLSFDPGENNTRSCEGKPQDLEQHNPLDNVVSSDAHGENTSIDLKMLPLVTSESSWEKPKSEACSLATGNYDESFPFPTGLAQEPSIVDVANAKSPVQTVDKEKCLELDHPCCPIVSGENMYNALPSLAIEQSSEICSSDDQPGKVLSTECVQVESCNVSSHHQPKSEGVTCEIDHAMSNDNGGNSQIASDPHDDGKAIQNTSNLDNCPTTGPVWDGVVAGSGVESGGCHCPNSGEISAFSLSAVKCQSVIKVVGQGQANEVSAASTAEVDSSVQAGSDELMQKSSADSTVTPVEACRAHGNGFASSSTRVAVEDPEDDSFESDVYQADKVHSIGNENNLDLQAGYDSQFEDGELRESDAQDYWDDDGEYGEVEQVDYDSECDEEANNAGQEKEIKVDRGSSQGSDHVTRKTEQCGVVGDSLRDDSVSPKTRVSDMTTDKDYLSGVVGSRTSNRDFLSSIEESDSIFRKDQTLRSRANNFYNLYTRGERDACSQKFMGRDRAVPHMRGRSPGGHRFVNDATGYCDSERRYFSTYRGNYTSGPPRTKGGFDSRRYLRASDHADSEAAGFAGFDNCARRQYINPSSNGVYERTIRRRSPTNRDDAYRLQTGALPVRDGSPIRSGFRRFPRGVARGIREEYHRSMPEDKIDYSNRFAPRLPRRERSISPLGRGQSRYAFTHKKSRSRSRSRSPCSYLPPRERNEGSRLRSRSPDFRSDARMDRVRLPFQKRFPADFEEGFMPTRRNHFTPQRNPRWLEDRNGSFDSSFRGRKSPVNMFRPGQRFDSMRSSRRLDSEDQFRPVIQSRKFNNMGAVGRGGEYDGSDDDRRKPSNRYGMVHPIRRYDTDSGVRRFRFNAEDSFVANNDAPNCEDGNRVADIKPRDALVMAGEE